MDKQMRGVMPVSQAAAELGVSRRRVRELVNADQLAARKPGHEVLVDAVAVRHRARSLAQGSRRPLSPKMAWAVLWLLGGHRPSWVSPTELMRVRDYAKRPLGQLPQLLARRADHIPARMLSSARQQARTLSQVAVGGAHAAIARGADLVVPDDVATIFYASPHGYERLRGLRGVRWGDRDANVSIRLVEPHNLSEAALTELLKGEVVPAAVAAADLLDEHDERAAQAAIRLLPGRGA
ncbi:helix-turn-helix domain-containing protein [Kutzneria buriramensis]|uniref:Excisionase family DNA binding protein n=1 Tax=Kutzneria buriramensis TaxID=1045776 RepID=A0A3E0GYC6_9PSEU|nr:helix-turn-helix domain-containing protein [Kutzneria buriramensis]REH31120.1 hypothetical protein BCF44_122143 [Kutzneria buriramensis]